MQPPSRRTFLKSTGAAAIGASALSPAISAAVDSRHPLADPRRIGLKLAIATICCDGFGNENFEPTFRIAPQAGFRHIEFNCWYPQNLTPAGLRSIAARCKAHGVHPISVQGNGFADGKAPDLSHKLWCMEAAVRLGCHRVKFTGARRNTKGGLPAIIATLKELAPAAEEMGILICVENHANNNLENIADYDQIFSAIDSPNVGLCLDTGHFDGAGIRIPEVIERFHSRTLHVDLKDCATFGTYKTVRFGEGITDLHGTVQALLDHGYQGYLVIEQAPPISPETLERDISEAYRIFQKYETPAEA